MCVVETFSCLPPSYTWRFEASDGNRLASPARCDRHVFGVRWDRGACGSLHARSSIVHCMHVWDPRTDRHLGGRLLRGVWAPFRRVTDLSAMPNCRLALLPIQTRTARLLISALWRRSAVRRRSVSLGISGSPGKAVSPKNKSFASGGSTAQYSGRESRVAVHRPPGRSAAVLSPGSSRLQRLRFRTPHVVRLPAVPSRNQICAQ